MGVRDGLLCKLGSRRYVVDVDDMTWVPIKPTRQGVDQGAGAGEASLTNEVVWRRVRDNWVGGAGQEYADLIDEGDESSPLRFNTSDNVNPWDRRGLSLNRPREIIAYTDTHVVPRTSGGTNGEIHASSCTHVDAWGGDESWGWVEIESAAYDDVAPLTLITTDTSSEYGLLFEVGDPLLGASHLSLHLNLTASATTHGTSFISASATSPANGDRVRFGFHLLQNGANIDCYFYEQEPDANGYWTGSWVQVGAVQTVAGTLVRRGGDIRIAGNEALGYSGPDRVFGFGSGYGNSLGMANLASAGLTSYLVLDFQNASGVAEGDPATDTELGIGAISGTGITGCTVTLSNYQTPLVDGLNENGISALIPVAGAWVGWPRGHVRAALISPRSIRVAYIDPNDPDEIDFYVNTNAGNNEDRYPAKVIRAATSLPDGTIFTIDNGAELWEFKYRSDILGYEYEVLNAANSWTMVAGCDSRLLGAVDGTLYEVAAAGTATEIYEHYATGFKWQGGIAAPNAIYAWGTGGGATEVFQIPVSDASGALDPPIPAVQLPAGERLNVMIEYLGVMVMGTTKGLRLAQINGDGSLALAAVIEEMGAVTSLAPDGRFVHVVGDTAPYAYRVDLSRFTDTLVPAFASESSEQDYVTLTPHATFDLPIHTVGLVVGDTDADAFDYGLDLQNYVTTTAYASDTAYFVTYLTNTANAETVCATGTIDLGWFTFGIGEPLSLDSVTVECDPLTAGSSWSVRVEVDTPDSTGVLDDTLDFTSGSSIDVFAANGSDVRATRFKVRLTLTGDTTEGTSPVVRRVVLRAAPAPFMSDGVVLPIMLRDTVESEHGQDVGLDVWDEWQYLINLRDTRERVAFELGEYTATVRVEGLEVRAGGLGGGNGLDGWDARSQWTKGTWQVSLVTVED